MNCRDRGYKVGFGGDQRGGSSANSCLRGFKVLDGFINEPRFEAKFVGGQHYSNHIKDAARSLVHVFLTGSVQGIK